MRSLFATATLLRELDAAAGTAWGRDAWAGTVTQNAEPWPGVLRNPTPADAHTLRPPAVGRVAHLAQPQLDRPPPGDGAGQGSSLCFEQLLGELFELPHPWPRA